MRATNEKRKGATSAVTRQEPLKSSELPSLTPKQQQQEKPSSAGDELQVKMKAAAKEFVNLTYEFWACAYEPGLRDMSDQNRAKAVFGPHVHCTPQDGGTVFLKQGREWIRLTLDYVTEAYREDVKSVKVDHRATVENTLKLVLSACKEHGKVSWVLPRLEKGVV